MANNLIGTEFQALPLDFLISAPLVAAVKAQRIAAETTKEFVESMIENGKPTTVDFEIQQISNDNPGAGSSLAVRAPLLAMVPVPHLRIDSLTTKFTFEISMTSTSSSTTDKQVEMKVSSGKLVSPWVSASMSGSISSKSAQESTTNRKGQLEITVQASESAMPEGLARVLSLMTSAIQTPDKSGNGGNE
jgi:Protein of unknown function (DUF2589)